MPIYVYERPDGSRFELRQGFNDAALTADPETGVPVRRVLQPAPVIFKGSGWYKTDSRAKPSEATEVKAAGTPAAEKGETKPDAASAKEAVSEATTKTKAEITKAAEKPATKPATPAAAT